MSRGGKQAAAAFTILTFPRTWRASVESTGKEGRKEALELPPSGRPVGGACGRPGQAQSSLARTSTAVTFCLRLVCVHAWPLAVLSRGFGKPRPDRFQPAEADGRAQGVNTRRERRRRGADSDAPIGTTFAIGVALVVRVEGEE